MGLVRADWHLPMAGAQVERGDPFGAELTRLQQADPFARLCELVHEEGALDAAGVTCPLKDRDWSHPSCSTCPERGDPDRAPLCRVGLAQEQVLATL